MSFTTLCTSTATSSLVSAMLAAAAIRRASGRTRAAGGSSAGARARALAQARPRRGRPSTSGSGRAASLPSWARSLGSLALLEFWFAWHGGRRVPRTFPSRRGPGWPLPSDLQRARPCQPTPGGVLLLTSFCTPVPLCVSEI